MNNKGLINRTTLVILLSGIINFALSQTYPPSCVITAPHSNAYYKESTDVVINVYATDIGKTQNNGTVTNVEFYNGTTKLGETNESDNNTYSFTWGCVSTGQYTITAVATNSSGTTFTSAGVIINVGTDDITSQGMSACKGKYLANITGYSEPNDDYLGYWNGVTAENGCKWGTVESTRDVMDWTYADVAYDFAEENNLMFRYHAIAWGSQYPSWIEDLSSDTAAFRAEIEEYMAVIADRYEYMDQIDVLNENMYQNTWDGEEHASGTPYFRAGLGGTGTTGYDWVIWLFQKARNYFPNSKLVMNDYELVGNTDGINEMLAVVKVLRDRGLIDGFGTQSHCFNVDQYQNSPETLTTSLDLMANSGLPVYVTELDLYGGDEVSETEQYESYYNLFPEYWEHSAVAGISLWGYVEGDTWQTGTGLLNSDRSERKAMTWLQDYVGGLDDTGYPYCQTTGCTSGGNPIVTITSPESTTAYTALSDIDITADVTDSDGTVSLVEFYNDTTKLGESTTLPYSFTVSDLEAGTYTIRVIATDDEGNTGSSSVIITVEPQTVEGTITIVAKGVEGDEIINLEVDGVIIETWTLTTEYAEYTATANINGVIIINYTNDSGDRDVQVDYIDVEGTVYQAEDQEINTAYYANGSCGGGSNSEMMHCDGYIQFATDAVADYCPDDDDKLEPGTCGCGVADTDTDSDGTPDCDDECPSDPDKIEAGECGCGIAEGACTSITINLTEGWNLVGCSLSGSTDIETAFVQIWSYFEVVKDMDGFYMKDQDSYLNSLDAISWGEGYYVKVSQDCTLEW